MKESIPGKIRLITYTPIQTNVLHKVKNGDKLTEYGLDAVFGDAASYFNSVGGSDDEKINEVKKYIKAKYWINEIQNNQVEKIKNIAKLSI